MARLDHSISPVRFGVLGQVRIRGTEDVLPATYLRRGLLALLLLHGNQLVPQDRIIRLLWSQPPLSARANLRSQLSQLRHDLDEAVPGLSNRITVQRSARGGGGGGIRMAIDEREVDLLEVERLVTAAQLNVKQRDSVTEALFQCHRAAGLWRGDFGVDLPDTDWFRAKSAAMVELRCVMAETLHTAELTTGHYHHALVGLNTAIAEYPYRDRLWLLLVGGYFLAGQPTKALESMRSCRSKYREVGLDAPSVLVQLHRPMLDDDRAAVKAILQIL